MEAHARSLINVNINWQLLLSKNGILSARNRLYGTCRRIFE